MRCSNIEQESSAGAIVFRKRNGKIEYLLLKYEAGHWDFPKGNIEKNEKDEATALREIEEEAGISDAKVLDGFRETIQYFYRREGRVVRKQVIFFLAETSGSEVKLSFEHTGFRWLPYEEAHGLVTFKNAREILEKANSFLNRKTGLKKYM